MNGDLDYEKHFLGSTAKSLETCGHEVKKEIEGVEVEKLPHFKVEIRQSQPLWWTGTGDGDFRQRELFWNNFRQQQLVAARAQLFRTLREWPRCNQSDKGLEVVYEDSGKVYWDCPHCRLLVGDSEESS